MFFRSRTSMSITQRSLTHSLFPSFLSPSPSFFLSLSPLSSIAEFCDHSKFTCIASSRDSRWLDTFQHSRQFVSIAEIQRGLIHVIIMERCVSVDNHTSIGTNINFFFLSIISSIVNIFFFLYIYKYKFSYRTYFFLAVEWNWHFNWFFSRVINIRTDAHLTSILGRKSNRPSLASVRVSFGRRCILSLVDVSLNKYRKF